MDSEESVMSPKLCLFWRGVVAAILAMGYYAIGLAVSGGLLYLSYRLSLIHNEYARILFLAASYIGSIIFIFLIPFPRRFQAPGPRLDPDGQPLFFEVVRRTAGKTGEAVPEEIYLIEDVDGGIAYRGGFLGIGSKRVMLIGLPLLHMLTVVQFEALLAFWFVYFGATHACIDECLLETKEGLYRVLHSRALPERWLKFNIFLFPFMWYRKVFLRAYGALSKRQRFMAAQGSGGLVSREALDGAIAAINRHGNAFADYFHDDVALSVRRGYHPPLMEGYRMYRESSGQTVDELPDAPASSLLKGTQWLEASVLKAHTSSPERPLKWIGWEEAGEGAVISHWTRLIHLNYSALDGLTLESLPATISNMDQFGSHTFASHEDDETRSWYAEEVLIAAFGSALNRAGGQIDYTPGSWSLRFGQTRITPRQIIQEMREADCTQDGWNRLLQSLKLDPAMSLTPPKEEQV
jgi:hypothetical protein